MRKLLVAIAIIASTLPIYSQNIKGESWKEVKNNKSGTLSFIITEAPGLIEKKGNTYEGLIPDINKKFVGFLKEVYGIKLELNYLLNESDFSLMLDIVKRNENIVGLSNVTITERRKTYLQFTEPFLTDYSLIVSNNNSTPINSIEDIKSTFIGFKAITLKGSTQQGLLESIAKSHWPNMNIITVNKHEQIVEALKTTQDYFTLMTFTEYFGDYSSNEYLTRHKVVLPESKNNLGIVMSKNSDWHQIYNEFLSSKYFNSDIKRTLVSENLSASFYNLINFY